MRPFATTSTHNWLPWLEDFWMRSWYQHHKGIDLIPMYCRFAAVSSVVAKIMTLVVAVQWFRRSFLVVFISPSFLICLLPSTMKRALVSTVANSWESIKVTTRDLPPSESTLPSWGAANGNAGSDGKGMLASEPDRPWGPFLCISFTCSTLFLSEYQIWPNKTRY